jgi:tetratricopeptide (TPR) repeat protein
VNLFSRQEQARHVLRPAFLHEILRTSRAACGRLRARAAGALGSVLAAALVLGLPIGSAHAQALDEIRLVSDGPDAVLQVRFNVRVQYQRHAPLEASDLIEIYFQLVGGDEALTRPIEETFSVKANAPAPEAKVTYPVQTGLPVKKIVVRLGRKVDFRVRAGVSNQMLEIVLPGLAPAEAGVRAPSPVVEKDRFAITLQSVPITQQSEVRAIPARLQEYSVFGSQVMRNGVAYYELVLGYFDSEAAAQKVLATVQADFPQAQVFDIVARKEANLENAAQLPPPAAPAAAPAAPEPAGPGAAAAAAAAVAAAPETDLDKQGAGLMAKARAALIAGKNDDAINTLNQLLLLPPNKYSQDAQELVGLARERAGDLVQARKEYELYLRLFPTGEGATRVRQRLASLAPPEAATTTAAKPQEKRPPQASAGGNISQYYYGGKQQVQTAFLNVPTNVNQQSITSTSQSSIVTTVDLNGRYRTENSDTRVVFRDSDQYSLIGATAPSLNRMDAAYVDYRDIKDGVSLKVGRQAGVTGGLVGRFDGAIVSYDIAPKLRINGVAGMPVSQDQFVNATQRFEGLSVEAQNFAEHWGGSAFVINQTADGVVDRRAVGGELRYFDPQKTLYSLIDYDVQFATVNAATIQGTYQFPDQTSLSLLLDDRKAPTLETSNGLLQAGCQTYFQYFAGLCGPAPGTPHTVDILRQDALATTANTHQLALDVSRPLGKQWQISGDLRVTSVGALPTVTLNGQTFQGSSATGNVLGATLQATGSNLYSRRDIDVFSVTHLHSSTLDGNQVGFNNLNGFLDNRLTVSPKLSLYRETDTNGQRLFRISPGVTTSYKLTQRMSIDGTIAAEHSRNEGPTQNDTVNNVFYYVGYHYDLN